MPKLIRVAYAQPLEVTIDLDSGEVVEVLAWGGAEVDDSLGDNTYRYEDDKDASKEDAKAAYQIAETTDWPGWSFG